MEQSVDEEEGSSSELDTPMTAMIQNMPYEQVIHTTRTMCKGNASQHTRMWLGPTSPWLLLKCWHPQPLPVSENLGLLALEARPQEFPQDIVLPLVHIDVYVFLGVSIFLMAIVFTICGLRDIHKFVVVLARNMAESKGLKRSISGGTDFPVAIPAAVPTEDELAKEKEQWSVLAIIGLCSLRFYTGFLSATWLPYLLAMEGQDLFGEKQAMFMAFAKLIYGASILLNPIFGFIGDQAISVSHSMGRRIFLRAGVTLAALGIYICVLAGRERAFLTFLSGILVWRLGEALNDVTTEALVPEIVPKEQFGLASAIKASTFLLGGLFGYAVLIIFADMHYSWLYYAYPIGMFFCVLPSISLLDRDRPYAQSQAKQEEQSLEEKKISESLLEAYVEPARYKGGFPLASLAVFLFGLGTSPMFFLLLIVRDLVGIADPVIAQQQFSWGSICFFLAAAVASILAAVLDPSKKQPHQHLEEQQDSKAQGEALLFRSRLLGISMIFCGTFVALLPVVVCWETYWARLMVFFLLASLFGASFGVSFSLFQDLTWKCLPRDVNLACAMGFNVMCRLSGIGLGNCICGLILDMSYDGERNKVGDEVYGTYGYIVMCSLSGALMYASTGVAYVAVNRALDVINGEGGKENVALDAGEERN